MHARLRSRSTLGILAASMACACGSSGYSNGPTSPPVSPPVSPPASSGRTINALPSIAFSPDSIRVAVGDTVTFAFGSVAHNVFFDRVAGAPGDIAGVNTNTSTTRVFTAAGRYAYECHLHAGMRGTVVVGAGQ
jgi:plastocyanin